MGKDKKVHTVVLLPWLKLGTDLEMGKYLFLRWPRKDNKFGEFTESLNSICGMYKYLDGDVESPQTIMIDKSRDLFERVEEQDRQAFQEAVTLLTTALIGENEFFRSLGNYVNSSLTELHYQNFSIGEDWVAFTSYKRDGYTSDMGYTFDEITVSTPPGCRMRGGCGKVEKAWLGALGKTIEKSTPLDRLVIEASDLFRQANTDSPSVLQITEVVMLANAFDRLFPSAKDRYQLSKAISKELKNWVNIRVEDSKRLAARQIVSSQLGPKYSGGWDIVQFWILELYVLRNSYVHGGDVTQLKWGWIPHEHLLMGAYVFPLLLKVIMSKEGRYELSEEDKYKLLAIDNLLDLNEFYDQKGRKSLWLETLSKIRFDACFEG
ncbi:MAG: hypothetical protein PHY02_01655 [Phycisphaerae bacterium]|nr:hypothetical protein [Phycisphaerae bacterium]